MLVADPPVLLHDVLGDVGPAVRLLEREAPYAPLGGWYNPGADPHARTRPMWFQHDWVHDDLHADGSDLFLWHERYIDTAKAFYGAEVVEPKSVYVNLMAAIAEGGPAHTDNPRFHGRDRTNTPMWLLRSMLWSGLFEQHEITQATAIWWLNDVDGGGGLRYWADGPDRAPHEHVGAMADTALVGDNHRMFHQVAPMAPDGEPTVLVTPSAELAPAVDGSGDWVVVDHGAVVHRAPLDEWRVSVLWKADVYATEHERDRRTRKLLSMTQVADVFDADLASRGSDLRLDLDRLDDPGQKAEFWSAYPEPTPVDAVPSVFERGR